MDGLYGKTLFELMIWGYPYSWKHPYGGTYMDLYMIMLKLRSPDKQREVVAEEHKASPNETPSMKHIDIHCLVNKTTSSVAFIKNIVL